MSIRGKLFSGRSANEGSTSDFRPSNDLERALAQAQARTIAIDDFFERLLGSQVALLLDKEVPESGWDHSISPLVLVSTRGGNVLAVFTSVERAARNSSSHNYPLLVDFRWVLKGVAATVGVVVNPGWQVGFEIEPWRVAELKRA